jgi:hypothetical protein
MRLVGGKTKISNPRGNRDVILGVKTKKPAILSAIGTSLLGGKKKKTVLLAALGTYLLGGKTKIQSFQRQ